MGIDNFNSKSESDEFDSFCSKLESLRIESDLDLTVSQINAIPIDKRVDLFLKILSSKKSKELKNLVISRLEQIFSTWLTETDFPEKLASDSYHHLFNLLIQEENETYKEQLLSSCLNLKIVMNKNKNNKYDLIEKMIITCVTIYDNSMTRMIREWLIKSPKIFGDELKQQLIQYKSLLTNCLQKIDAKPHLISFAMDILRLLLLKYDSEFCLRIFSPLAPLLMDVMSKQVITENGANFMTNLHSLLLKEHNIFKRELIWNVQKVAKLLDNNNTIERSVVVLIHDWITLLITQYPEEIEKNCTDHIPMIIENMCGYLIDLHHNYPKEWLTEFFNSREIFFSVSQKVTVNSNIRSIAGTLRCKTMAAILSNRVEQLFKSNDWKSMAIRLDLLHFFVKVCSSGVHMAPFHAFQQASQYFSNENSKVICSAVNVVDSLCETFSEESYSDIHDKAICLIINTAATHDSILVKVTSLCAFGNISKNCILGLEVRQNNIKNLFKLVLDIFVAIIDCEDIEMLKLLTKAIHDNVHYIFKLLKYNAGRQLVHDIGKFVPSLVNNLLAVLDKIYSAYGFNFQTHKLLDCIYESKMYALRSEYEAVDKLIVNYIYNFNKNHSLCDESRELQPCFFHILLKLTNSFDTNLEPLIPKVIFSLAKSLGDIKKQILNTDDVEMKRKSRLSPPFECSECASNEYDGGLSLVCDLFENWITMSETDLSRYIELFLQTLFEILEKVLNTPFYYYVSNNIYKILCCAINSKKATGAKKVWNSFIKPKILYILKNCSNFDIFVEVLDNFSNCITIESFDDALNSTEFKLFAEIINSTISKLIEMNDNLKKYESCEADANTLSIQKTLDSMQDCLNKILSFYKETAIIFIVPLFKTLAAYSKSKYSKGFIYFLNCVMYDVFEFVPKNKIEQNKLTLIFFNFTTKVLSEFTDEETLKYTVGVLLMLKKNFPQFYKKHLLSLDLSSNSKVNDLISNYPDADLWEEIFI